ncbi:MAG TPA: tetratricopeptide repeat protein, partial [Labilithrix sp.]|nr:tetratricopeptide repeat protein [Labilithrix sp.]
RALEADPEAVLVAARLAQIQAKEGAWAELARVLRRGLTNARSREAVVPMAAELADVAKNRLRDPRLAIEALERSREISPDHVPALFLLAELYIGQRTWEEALRALGDVVACTTERSEKLVALVGRASILARVLQRPADAEQELRAALVVDPHDPRALRGLLALAVPLDASERAALLSRLVIAETEAPARLAALLELAKVRRQLGDHPGAEGALVEAAALSPDPAMLARLREAAGGDAETAARVLGRALTRAREGGASPGAPWLVSLGELELGLGRLDAAIEHFEEALELEPMREPARVALARALSRKGRHETAAATLTPLLDAGGGILEVSFVRQLDEALTGAGRTQQALVAKELRALAGDLDAPGTAALAARRAMHLTNGESLSGKVLRSFVMPGGLGKHPLWDVAAIAATLSGKLARVGLAEQGASTRDRVKPKAVHALRQLFDRLTRSFELFDLELAVSDSAAAPLVACEDATWLIVPSAFAGWPEPQAIAALARPLARIALGVPWFGAMPPEETLALLVAVARQAVPSVEGAPRDRVEPLVADYELRARRAIDRKRRKALDDLDGTLAQAPPMKVDAFAEAVLRTEARASFLLSGDLRSSLAALGTTEAGLPEALRSPGRVALAGVLTRPIARDLTAFAIGGDATALRRSLGTLWD